jgi:hypothetical protein
MAAGCSEFLMIIPAGSGLEGFSHPLQEKRDVLFSP